MLRGRNIIKGEGGRQGGQNSPSPLTSLLACKKLCSVSSLNRNNWRPNVGPSALTSPGKGFRRVTHPLRGSRPLSGASCRGSNSGWRRLWIDVVSLAVLQHLLATRHFPYFVAHICSHTPLPGPLTEGNARADRALRGQDRCGFQPGACDQHLNNMAWHQGLSNPIPEFQLTLEETALPPESATAGRKRRRRNVPSQPVTGGAVKALVATAQRKLAADQQPETPKTLFVAILAQITANSVMIVCLLCLLFPVGVGSEAPPPLQARRRIRYCSLLMLIFSPSILAWLIGAWPTILCLARLYSFTHRTRPGLTMSPVRV
ncbi:uncharacterized protein [Lepidochelys kempii]|uniref:uncharacterized protein n=1 Tax=Lepidochelys kempii TaxID=8472 RepID=UPI003C6F0854